MQRVLILLAAAVGLAALPTPGQAQFSLGCAVPSCSFWMAWQSSTVSMGFDSGSPNHFVRELTISGLPERQYLPIAWLNDYNLRFGPCPPEGYCRDPYAVEYEPNSRLFESFGWSLSAGPTWFRMTHPEGVAAQTLYFNDPLSWLYGPTVRWDLSEATVTMVTVVPEPGTLLLMAMGLAGLVAVVRRRRTLGVAMAAPR